ncbi:MAG: GNAT family N-acetyltransferase [Clostridia bacterium]|nr:GNAT family N-acetyltransferase [Clostridia bacterium]
MIILITGASHCGKTLLAQKLLEKHNYPYLSVDHLKMGLIRSGNTRLTPEDDDELTVYLWPIVREIAKTAIENKQNLIIEGCYIPFEWRKDFQEEYLNSIRFICLAMSDAYIDAHFHDIKAHSSDIESRLFEQNFTASDLKAWNRRVIEGFRASGEDIKLIETDYAGVIERLTDEETDEQNENAMLKRITQFKDIDQRKLMDIYLKGNLEEAEYQYPEIEDKQEAARLIEESFLEWLEGEFFKRPEDTYWILEENGVWISALRTSRIEDGLYYLEALETHGDYRKRGYASTLVNAVIDALKEGGAFRLCDCVHKANEASLNTHKKCGFEIVADNGYCYLYGSTNERTYGLEYRYDGE